MTIRSSYSAFSRDSAGSIIAKSRSWVVVPMHRMRTG